MSELASQRKCEKRALLVGEHRIDRGIVEIDQFLAGIALVVLGDPVRQIAAATDEPLPWVMMRAPASIGLLHLHQAFLRIGLVVEGKDLELLAGGAALGVELIGEELEGLEADLADAWRPDPRADRCRRS